jgi:uncharacterized protein YhfF
VFIDVAACDAFWRAYLAELPADHPHRAAKPDSFGFGDEPDLAEELAALVLAGQKRATASLAAEYTVLGEPLPQVGDVSIIVRGDGRPVALVERTRIDTVPFQDVDERFAATEGEGDGSLSYWRAVHLEYFGELCRRLGGTFEPHMPVICQVFRLIYKAEV